GPAAGGEDPRAALAGPHDPRQVTSACSAATRCAYSRAEDPMIALALLFAAAPAATTSAAKTSIVPAGEDRAYDDWHYSPAVRVGDLLFVSGIPAARGDTYEAKVRNMFERLKRVLAAAGADLSDVVELQTFHANARDTEAFNKEFEELSKVHHEYFPA